MVPKKKYPRKRKVIATFFFILVSCWSSCSNIIINQIKLQLELIFQYTDIWIRWSSARHRLDITVRKVDLCFTPALSHPFLQYFFNFMHYFDLKTINHFILQTSTRFSYLFDDLCPILPVSLWIFIHFILYPYFLFIFFYLLFSYTCALCR